MKRSRPAQALLLLCAFLLPGIGVCQDGSLALSTTLGKMEADSAAANESASVSDDPAIPAGLQNIMQRARREYLEGSNLIKAGDCAKARDSFNKAVDLLLQCEYELNSTPALKRFFEDLIHRIQQDESHYLRPPGGPEEDAESAVVDELDTLDLIPITVDPSLQDKVAADLADTKYDIPIMLNDKVFKALDYWLNRGRRYFADGLIRSGRYREMIEKIFREEELPLDLMYLAQVESLFKTNAVSRAQAKGIWQFARGTAIRYGLKVNSYVDERSDPEKSTRAAARYLSDLFAMFKDWNLVLAAYNWGEGKVQRLVERSGSNNFWELSDLKRKLPDETKNHVPLIMASIILARNPEKYSFPNELDAPLAYDLVSVSRPIDLRAAAKILQISLDEMKQLNPSLRGLSTPPNFPDFQLKVPSGSDNALYQKIAELPAVKLRPPPEYGNRYKVRAGDTLSSIAQRFRVPLTELQRANAGVSARSLRAGNWIQVPRSMGSRVKSKTAQTRIKKAPASSKSLSSAPTRSSVKSTPRKKATPMAAKQSSSR
jgi:membrane-bound lytic murein transglycosylase D